MLLIEKEFQIPRTNEPLIQYFGDWIDGVVGEGDIPVRFAVTATDLDTYHCELGILTDAPEVAAEHAESIFGHGSIPPFFG